MAETATISAGELIHRIMIERPDPDSPKDSAGQRIINWLPVVATSIAARVSPVSGRSAFLAAQKRASTTHTVKIRYSPSLKGVDASCRVLFYGRPLYLDEPPENVEEANVLFVLRCTEGMRTTA